MVRCNFANFSAVENTCYADEIEVQYIKAVESEPF